MLPVLMGPSNELQFSVFNPSFYAAAASKGKGKGKKPVKKPSRGKPSKTRDIVINPPTGGGGTGGNQS